MGVVKSIDTVFNNNEFLMTAAAGLNKFDEDRLYRILTITLNYFLATRDTRTNFGVSDIESEYQKINDRYLTNEQVEQFIINSFLTHSFNASERGYIEKYGFDYWFKISQSERDELTSIHKMLQVLEHELGKNPYLSFRESDNDISIVEQEVYMTFPGTKTIHYAKNTPERFYLGPVGRYSFFDFPMVVGESKKDYLMRILKYRIENQTYNANQEELYSIAERIVEYYTQYGSSIAFIRLMDMIDKPVYAIRYDSEGANSLNEFCSAMMNGRYRFGHIFTHQRNDRPEAYESGNLVTLAKYIPTNLNFAKFPNVYDLKQQYLSESGIPEGVPVRYKDCTRVESMSNYPETIRRYYR